MRPRSLPMRGEWIEIGYLKIRKEVGMSLPMRGEWIEIPFANAIAFCKKSLPMRGEWIEILPLYNLNPVVTGLSPCGESGLKYL